MPLGTWAQLGWPCHCLPLVQRQQGWQQGLVGQQLGGSWEPGFVTPLNSLLLDAFKKWQLQVHEKTVPVLMFIDFLGLSLQ